MKNTTILRITSYLLIIIGMGSCTAFVSLGDSTLPIQSLFLYMVLFLAIGILLCWLGIRLECMRLSVKIGDISIEHDEEETMFYHIDDKTRKENFLDICRNIGIDPMKPINNEE